MSTGWQAFVFLIVLASFIAHFLFLHFTSRFKPSEQDSVGNGNTTGHVWDGDLEEYNNPLPKWWYWLFQLSVVFSIGYLVLYPGSGVFDGALNWSQTGQYSEEITAADARYGKVFAAYVEQDLTSLKQDAAAMTAGLNLFGNHCAQCHGSDARGAFGFPNLSDNDWQWGNSYEQIIASISNGRNGIMPPWGAVLGGEPMVSEVAHYVRSLSGLQHDAAMASNGQLKYTQFCVACHAADGSGNQALGAPALNDAAWLYDASIDSIKQAINEGRNNQMPMFSASLSSDQIKVLAAYVQRLSETAAPTHAQ